MNLPENFKIGTCGFGRTRKDEFAKRLNCVEIQHTFYNPPQVKTLEKWRSEMPSNFEFTLKAWQMITHDAGTPTYRRLKREMTEKETAEAGSFRPTTPSNLPGKRRSHLPTLSVHGRSFFSVLRNLLRLPKTSRTCVGFSKVLTAAI